MGASASTQKKGAECVAYWREILKAFSAAGREGKDDVHYGAGEGLAADLSNIQRDASDRLVMAVGASLHKVGFPVKHGSAEEVIASIPNAGIPDPEATKPMKFSSKPEVQEKAINAVMGAFEKCGGAPVSGKENVYNSAQKLGDLVPKLTEGCLEEFTLVMENLRRNLKNLELLKQMLDRVFTRLEEKIRASEGDVQANTTALRNAHKLITEEQERQLSMLRAMLKETEEKAPLGDINKIKEKSANLNRLVKKIKLHHPPGSHGEMMAHMFNSMTTLATAANMVNKALKDLGVKYSEYSKVKSAKELDDLLTDKVREFLKEDKDFAQYMKAAQVLYQHQYMHDDILKELDSKSGAAEKPAEPAVGGAKLDKRVEERKKVREGLLRAFIQSLGQSLDRFLHTCQAIANGIGAGKVPLTDSLEKFSRSLDSLPNIQKKYIYYSLSGYDRSVASKETRETYVSSVKYVISVIDEVIKEGGAHAAHFKDLKSALEAMLRTIGEYVQKFEEGFQTILPPMSLPKEAFGAGEAKEDESADVTGGADFPEMSRVGYSLEQLKQTIQYYFRTAKIRDNLKRMAQEIPSYQSGYMKVLGDAVAASIDEEVKWLRTELAKLEVPASWDPKLLTERPLVAELCFEVKGTGAELKKGKDLDEARSKLEALRELLTKQSEARVNMVRTAEAMEIYLNNFHAGIASHHDAIKDVFQALEQTEWSAAWFTTRSGEAMAQVFEVFPAAVDTAGGRDRMRKVQASFDAGLKDSKKHYYEVVAEVCGLKTGAPAPAIGLSTLNVALPGNPLVAINVVDAKEKLIRRLEAGLGVTALKNMIAAFINIGDHLGTKLSDKAAMAPIQMYKNLLNYMVYSSFAIGQKTDGGLKLTTAELGLNGNFELPVDPVNTSYAGRDALSFGAVAGAASVPAAIVPPAPEDIQKLADSIATHRQEAIHTSVTLRSVAVDEKKASEILLPLSPAHKTADKLFNLVVQAIPAKILIAVGVYNLFNHPVDSNGLGWFSPLRLVMGGNLAVPKILDENVPLYIRLPLYVEFFRYIFNFDVLEDGKPQADDKFRAISMVPEVDGIFGGLIQLIFDKARYVKDGAYSDTDNRLMIEEINKIASRFKGKDMVSRVIHELTAEMNRRYGIYSRSERVKYLNERKQQYQDKYQEPEEITDFELKGLSEHSFPKPLPSQAYQTEGLGAAGKPVHKHKIEFENQGLITQLRTAIDSIFEEGRKGLIDVNVEQGENLDNIRKTISFDQLIRSKHEELKHAKSDKERFEVVVSAMNNLGRFATSALEKNLIMFHETVVAPLNVLHSIFQSLRAFNDRIKALDTAITDIKKDYNDKTPAANYVFGTYQTAANPKPYRYTAGADNAVRKFQQGSPEDRSIGDVLIAAGRFHAKKPDIAAELIRRFGLDQARMLRETFESLYAHSAGLGKLVSLRVEVAKKNEDGSDTCQVAASLDHSALYEAISQAHNGVKMALERFRGLLPNELLSYFEKNDEANSCSLYSIEKRDIDQFLHGKKFATDLDKVETPAEVDSFDRVNERVNRVLEFFNTTWKASAAGLSNAMVAAGGVPATLDADFAATEGCHGVNADGTVNANKVAYRHEFTDAVLNLVYRSATLSVINPWVSAPVGPNAATKPDGLAKLLFNGSSKSKLGVDPGKSWFGGDAFGATPALYDPVNGYKDDNLRGLVITVNRLLAAYVNTVYDSSSRKVYIQTLNKFANGAFTKAVMGTERLLDNGIAPSNIIGRTSKTPSTKGIIAASIAQAIKQLVTEPGEKGDKKEYLEPDLAEIPLYLKERLRAALPIFHRQLQLLIKRADLLKTFIRAVDLTQAADLKDAAGAALPGLVHMTNADNEIAQTSTVDEVILACVSLSECIQETLKDLADEPKLGETHQGFYSEYEALNGQPAFAPASSLLYALHYNMYDTNTDQNKLLVPTASLGENRFKFQYASRALYQEVVKPEHMPGLALIAKQHNQSCDPKHHFSEKDLVALTGPHFALLKHLIDQRRHAGLLVSYQKADGANAVQADETCHFNIKLVSTLPGEWKDRIASSGDVDKNRVVFSLSETMPDVTLQEIIRMTEANTQKEQRLKIVQRLDSNRKECCLAGTRNQMIAYNIMDMNIVPINLAALQREVAFNSLFNYGYTCVRLIEEMFYVPRPVSEAIKFGAIDAQDPATARALFCQLMKDPEMPISQPVYESLVSQIVRGDLGVQGLAQPKYLGQELWNKPLFGEVYAAKVDEVDAGTGNARTRGRTDVLRDMRPDLSLYVLPEVAVLTEVLSYLLVHSSVASLRVASRNWVGVDANIQAVAAAAITVVNAPAGGDAALTAAVNNLTNDAGGRDIAKKVAIAAAALLRSPHLKNLVRSSIEAIRKNPGVTNSETVSNMSAVVSAILDTVAHIKTWTAGATTTVTNLQLPAGAKRAADDAEIKKFLPANFETTNLAALTAPTADNAETAAAATQRVEDRLTQELSNEPGLNPAVKTDLPKTIKAANPDYFPKELHYLAPKKTDAAGVVTAVNVGAYKGFLQQLGKIRFDTLLIRRQFWISNLHRVLRLKLQRDAGWANQKIVSGMALAAPGVTELYDHHTHRDPSKLYMY